MVEEKMSQNLREPKTRDALRESLRAVVDLCKRGFHEDDKKYYDEIAKILRPFSENESVNGIIKLAGGGNRLSSHRFAYPHIEDRARDLLVEMMK